MNKHTFITGLILLLTSCTQGQAPVEDLGKKVYGYSGDSSVNEPMHENSGSNSHYNSNYTNSPQSTSVASVGESDLAPVQGSKIGKGAVVSNDNHISVTDENASSPFSTPPSKPLEQPLTATQPTATQASAAPAPAAKIYDKDGITLIWPVIGGKVTSHFKNAANDGINISISEGEPIVAAASGTVVYSGNDLKDYGNMVILRHDNSWLTAYANASRIVVKKAAYVKQGDIIAYVGSSGGVKTPQLHFALRKGKAPVDPEQYLPAN